MGKLLSVHKSNKLDVLVALLSKLQQIENKPFQIDYFVVYTEGIKQYLRMNLSKNSGITANLEFSHPSDFFWNIAQRCLSVDKINYFQPEKLVWIIFNLFKSKDFAKDYPTISQETTNYLQKYHTAAFDLANELAILFNHYMIYRPKWIETWSKNKLVAELPLKDQLWQKDLWLYLATKLNSYNRVETWEELKELLEQPILPNDIELPPKINIFSITSLAPLYLELIDLLSNHIPIHLFLLSPCQENWLDAQLEHPLLDSLGKQGKDFFKLLPDYIPVFEQEAFILNSDEVNPSLLHIIQDDILELKTPSNIAKTKGNLTLLRKDPSIQIHAAHSMVRELHILKNQLLLFLQENPTVSFEEIGVLSPHIENYLPYIKGIFGYHSADSIALPFSITDIKIKIQEPFLTGLELLIEFLSQRFDVESVLELLNHPLISQQFEFSKQNLRQIAIILKKINISWGLNQNQRKHFGAANNQFTWEKGLNNLQIIINNPPENSSGFTVPTLFAELYNNEENSEETTENIKDTIQRLIQFIDSIKQFYMDWHKQNLTMRNWIVFLKEMISVLFPVNSATQKPIQDFFNQLNKLNQITILTHFDEKVDALTFSHLINKELNIISSAGFINGGITFASLMPMRTIPYKFVALIGMDDRAFPRQNLHTSFDLIQLGKRQLGDLSRRDDDRYLFLETLISTQSQLYISYIGHSLEKNEALNPSPIVSELLSLVAEMTKIAMAELEKHWVIHHPLQNFSKRYFYENNLLNYREDYLTAYHQEAKLKTHFLAGFNEETNFPKIIQYQDFLKFWRNPIRHWLKQHLELTTPWLDFEIDYNEIFSLHNISKLPFQTTKLASRFNQNGEFIIKSLFESSINNQDLASTQKKLFNLDYYPSGLMGEVSSKKLTENYKTFLKTQLTEQHTVLSLLKEKKSPEDFNIRIANIFITGEFENIFNNHLVFFENNTTISKKKMIDAYLSHLLLNCYQANRHTFILSIEKIIHFQALSKKDAELILEKWLTNMQLGFKQPLALFYPTSFELAEKYHNSKGEIDKEAIITEIFDDSADMTYFENNLLFNDLKTLLENKTIWPVIEDLLMPILENQKVIEIS